MSSMYSTKSLTQRLMPVQPHTFMLPPLQLQLPTLSPLHLHFSITSTLWHPQCCSCNLLHTGAPSHVLHFGGGEDRAGRLCHGKATGPGGVCPRLEDCAAKLSEPLQRVFTLNLQLGKGLVAVDKIMPCSIIIRNSITKNICFTTVSRIFCPHSRPL